jgi:hypothetical protein
VRNLRRLGRGEEVRYERDAVEGSDGEGMPRGINAALLEVVGPEMAKARAAFPGGREALSSDFLFAQISGYVSLFSGFGFELFWWIIGPE